MSLAKIKVKDQVKVIAGKHRGHIGPIIKVITKKDRKFVVVSGLPKRVKYRKKTRFDGQVYSGKKTEIDMTIDISNVALVCNEEGQVSKIYTDFDGKNKVRIFKKNKQPVSK